MASGKIKTLHLLLKNILLIIKHLNHMSTLCRYPFFGQNSQKELFYQSFYGKPGFGIWWGHSEKTLPNMSGKKICTEIKRLENKMQQIYIAYQKLSHWQIRKSIDYKVIQDDSWQINRFSFIAQRFHSLLKANINNRQSTNINPISRKSGPIRC